ncbi:ABC transporter permease [Rhodocyclus tenuis]|uniref:FtsX-like permease family protein n=2 Tax=Rhodocyclus TaxID=1064 RepID=A0A6L5JWL8_RHOTE|nr:FtsX-like permease family protein [Rhodocyclus gracilis]MQY51745.1 FtsX-like permease family protein [Rhodocyclus gracilis]MRD73225.1 FtsX-like permease family protein [Rhodocyclus gracilis]NJA88994.1 ABC transporter permease [Rhodocyclus gracilis]
MLLALIFRNAFRHRLRTLLTMVGLAVAILAYGLLSTVISAWYAGADGASGARLITRNSISLVFPLPITYREKIRQIDGVRAITLANWFGGVYKEPKNFFPQFAIEPESYLNIYSEFRLTDEERREFLRDRKGCIVGAKLARTYGFKVGDTITLQGRVFPGNWDFVIRGIYTGRDAKTDVSQMLFHWDYLNETLKKRWPGRANEVGVYVVDIGDSARAAEISRAIDIQFKNSNAETLTETDRAFQLGFVSRTESIVVAIRLVSYVVIFIILAVMANTMAMTVRERTAEYATLKALGFSPLFVILLIYGESLAIAAIGGGVGIAATFPVAALFAKTLGKFFPVFDVSSTTVGLQMLWALLVGLISAFFPARRAARVKIVDGLRSIG